MTQIPTYDADLLLDLASAMDEWGTFNEIWAARNERDMAEIMAITGANERELSFVRNQVREISDNLNHLLTGDVLFIVKELVKRGFDCTQAIEALHAFGAFWNKRVVK